MHVKHALTVALAFLFGGIGGFFLSNRETEGASADHHEACVPSSGGGDHDRSPAKRPSGRMVREANDEDDGGAVEAVEEATFVIGDGVTEIVETTEGESSDTADEGTASTAEFSAEDLAEIQRRRAAYRAELLQARARKLAFIDSINTDFLTDEQKVAHAEYAETLAARNAAKARIREAVKRGDESTGADRTLVRECEAKLLSQASVERKLLLEAAVRSVGLEGTAVDEFLDILESIDSCTSSLKD